MGASRSMLLVLAIGSFSISSGALAQNVTVATVESLQGSVQSGGAPVFEGQRITPAARLTTGPGSQLVLRFGDGMRVALSEQTIFVPAAFGEGRTAFDLLGGAARVRTGGLVRSNPERLTVRTPQAQFGVKGPADFTLVVSDATYLSVSEGTVIATNAGGQAEFAAGSGAQVRGPGTAAASLTAAPAGVAATASALGGVDLERKAEEEAARAAAEKEIERIAGPPPRAQQFWAGASGLVTAYDDNTTGRLLSSGDQDTTALGFKVFAGWQFSRYFGVEVGYVDLGKVDYSGTFQGMPVTDGELHVTGFDAALVLSLAASTNVTAFAKAGVLTWEAEADDVAGGVPFSTSTNGEDILLGVGFAYAVRPNGAIRAEFELRRTAAEAIGVLSVGYEFRF